MTLKLQEILNCKLRRTKMLISRAKYLTFGQENIFDYNIRSILTLIFFTICVSFIPLQ